MEPANGRKAGKADEGGESGDEPGALRNETGRYPPAGRYQRNFDRLS